MADARKHWGGRAVRGSSTEEVSRRVDHGAADAGVGDRRESAVFSLVDVVLFHPLPYNNPERLLLVTESEPAQGAEEYGVAIQEARDYESRSHSFAQMGTFEGTAFNLTGSGEPLRVNGAMFRRAYFNCWK